MARLDPLEIERKPVETASEIVVRGYMQNFGTWGHAGVGGSERRRAGVLVWMVVMW